MIELLKTQKAFDDRVGDTPILNIMTAFSVELGELMNEWGGFKTWKKSHEVDKHLLTMELADCLAFSFSGMIALNQNVRIETLNEQIENSIGSMQEIVRKENMTKYDTFILSIYMYATHAAFDVEAFQVGSPVASVLQLAEILDITREELFEAYQAKMKVNHARQDHGY